MSDVKSFRFNDETIDVLEFISYELGISEKDVISKALELYETQLLKSKDIDVICDFQDCVDGINTDVVTTFIEQINEYTIFKTACYLDGDKIGFNLKKD